MFTPIVLGASVVGFWPEDVCADSIVVESLGGEVRKVSEAVPLGAALGVQLVRVVVGKVFGQGLDFVLEGFAGEGGVGWVVEGETEVDVLEPWR